MITLSISSSREITIQELAQFFANRHLKANITATTSSVPCVDDPDQHRVEQGFTLLIFDIDGPTFKQVVWEPLQKLLNLSCAFVKYRQDYMGCVLNWPGVFVESQCPGKTTNMDNGNSI